MRSRLPALGIALVLLGASACAQGEDVRTDGPGSTTTTTEATPSDQVATLEDLVAAFEAEGYEVTELTVEALGADVEAEEVGVYEVDGGELVEAVDFEAYVFTDESAAEEGRLEIRDQTTDPDVDGGPFTDRNTNIVGLFGCDCEADFQLADVFTDLDLVGAASTSPTEDPEPEPEPEGASVEDVIEGFEDEGYEVSELDPEAMELDLEGTVATALIEVEGAVDPVDVELYVFADADAAEEAADRLRSDDEDAPVGGAFQAVNANVLASFGCVCEADSEIADVFTELDLAGEAVDPGEDERPDRVEIPGGASGTGVSDLIDALESEGTAAEVSELPPSTDAPSAAVDEARLLVERDDEGGEVEVFVFAEPEAATDAGAELRDSIREACGACDAELDQVEVNGLFVAVVPPSSDWFGEVFAELDLG